ncbi:MAG: SBBP repeat-containing protein [Pyrinomonadaceae bacterium]
MFRKFQELFATLAVASFICSINVAGNDADAAIDVSSAKQSADYGKMPVLFEQNKGQTNNEVKFVARGPGYTLYLTESGAEFSLKRADQESQVAEIATKGTRSQANLQTDTLKMQFVGANSNPVVTGDDAAITKTNYYIGKRRIENVSNYTRVNYKNIYNGIDAVFYSNKNNQLEYDFVVAPNTDANQIGFKFDGADSPAVNSDGDLVIKTDNAELVQQKPFAYQTIDGKRKEVAVSYQVTNDRVSFGLGEYDRSLPLVIDPVLDYLTYIGGTALDDVFEVAADTEGSAYFTGLTGSLNFHGDTRDDNDANGAYVAKLNADGTAFVYITILEGNGDDAARGIALDSTNNAYVTGIASHFFPTTSGAYDTVHGVLNNADVFVAKLNTTGGLVYSSFLGGTDLDEGFDIAVDASGKAYVVGATYSNSAFPTKNRYQGCGVVSPLGSFDSQDAFLTVMNAAGSNITYSSCIGNTVGVIGFSDEQAFSVELDSSNNAYVTGITNSNNFKVKNALQPNIGGGKDAWIAKFNPTASGDASVVYATFLGGTGTDQGNGVAVDSSGQAHVVGLTGSVNFPLANAFRTTNQINEAFVTVLSSTGASLVNSSFLGGANQDRANNVALDSTGSIYVTGNTLSDDFPMALPFQATRAGVRDAFVAKVKFGRGVVSSSYLGGNGNDNGDGIAVKGNFIYVGGDTASTNLATTDGVVKETTTNADGFVAKILDTRLDSVGVFRPQFTFQITQSTTNVVTQTLSFTTPIGGNRGVAGDFNGDGIDSTGSFTDGVWKVRDVNFPIANITPKTINFGQAGDLPVVGDWNNDGIDTPGVYRPSVGDFLLTNSTATNPPVDITVDFGLAEDKPVAGDWDGDGFDSVGVFRPSASTFFLTNDNVLVAAIDFVSVFGIAEDLPIAGDFDGNGVDTIGVWRPSTREFFLSNNNVNVDANFVFGLSGGQPIAGDWDGRPLP